MSFSPHVTKKFKKLGPQVLPTYVSNLVYLFSIVGLLTHTLVMILDGVLLDV